MNSVTTEETYNRKKTNQSVNPGRVMPKKLNLPLNGLPTTIYGDTGEHKFGNPSFSSTGASQQSKKKDKLTIAQKRAHISSIVK